MRANLLIRYTLGLSLLIYSLVSQAQQLLNGVAVHQELGQDVFIGAVYSDTLSNKPEALLQGKQAMRMELKIVSPDGLSTRRFSRLWIEGMAVNNNNDVLTQQAENMVKFDGFFKGRFATNDHIIFSNVPGKGVDIIVNNAAVGTIKDNAFFSMLLSTWIGKVPLSSEFRDGLLKMGNVDDGLRGRFVSITSSTTRVAEVTSAPSQPAVAAATPAKSAAAKASVAATPEPPKVAKVDLPPPPTASIDKPAVAVPVPPPPVVVSTPTPAAASGPTSTPVAAVSTPKSVAASSVKPIASAAAKPVVVAVAKAPVVDDDDEEDAPALTAQSLLARQFYVSDAIKKIKGVTSYPQRAAEKGQEGSIRIAVVVDREGKILETKVLEESKHSLLNKEASAAIKRAAPFASLPSALPGKKFEFSVPIRFAMPKPQ